MPEIMHLDVCGNRIEVGDWVITRGLFAPETLLVGVVTKLCEKTVTVDSFVCDEISLRIGESPYEFSIVSPGSFVVLRRHAFRILFS